MLGHRIGNCQLLGRVGGQRASGRVGVEAAIGTRIQVAAPAIVRDPAVLRRAAVFVGQTEARRERERLAQVPVDLTEGRRGPVGIVGKAVRLNPVQ